MPEIFVEFDQDGVPLPNPWVDLSVNERDYREWEAQHAKTTPHTNLGPITVDGEKRMLIFVLMAAPQPLWMGVQSGLNTFMIPSFLLVPLKQIIETERYVKGEESQVKEKPKIILPPGMGGR